MGDQGPASPLHIDDTVLFAPAAEDGGSSSASAPGRLIRVITGTGFGCRVQDPAA